MTFAEEYLAEAASVLAGVDAAAVERMATALLWLRANRGRLFVVGVGGSAAHASHAVSDFRKMCGIEAYCPLDNVAELTARINDDGWQSSLSGWLKVSRLGPADGLLVFSVGGGNRMAGVSTNIVEAVELARSVGAAVFGVVGRDGGHTAAAADVAVVIPPLFGRVTAHTEGVAAIIWHLLVSHPALTKAAR